MVDSVRSNIADLVTAEILIDGKTAPDTAIFTRIEIDQRLNHLPRARLTLDDGSPALSDFSQSSSSIFVPGAEVDIRLGYHARNTSVFKGIILGQTIRLDRLKRSELVVTCGDKAQKLTLSRQSAQFQDATDSDILSMILSQAGLSAKVTSTSVKRLQQVQNGASDWDFILSRAEANGMVVSVADAQVTVAPPKMETAKLQAEFGDTISWMDLDLDATQQLSDVSATSWDPKTQEVLSAKATEPSLNDQGNLDGKKLAKTLDVAAILQSQAPLPDPELKAWADAQMLKSRLSRIRGRVGFSGTAQIRIGDLLDLEGLGKRFNGAGYVSAVHHHLAEGEWQTEVTLGLPRDWFADACRDVSAPPAAALRPGVSGLQIAKVLKTDEDPDGARRIKVSMPLQQNGDQGIWVRLATPYASKGFGMAFLPEIEDEVVLGFLNGDPDAGIVLGALQSGARPAPVVPDEKNTVKIIQTRSELKLSFDDEKKILQFETPGGHIVTLSDEDKTVTVTDTTGNTLKMSEGGIDLTSPKDVSISATGKISLSGDQGITATSSAGDVAAQGVNATLKGDMSAKVDGGASAELSGGMEAKVQAAMVMIN